MFFACGCGRAWAEGGGGAGRGGAGRGGAGRRGAGRGEARRGGAGANPAEIPSALQDYGPQGGGRAIAAEA